MSVFFSPLAGDSNLPLLGWWVGGFAHIGFDDPKVLKKVLKKIDSLKKVLKKVNSLKKVLKKVDSFF